jgi:predicted MPP superfamily phosphohydrolase
MSVPKMLGWAAFGTGAYALVEPHRIAVRHWEVFLPGLPREAEGMKIVQASDLHISAMTGTKILARAVALINGLQPDVVALTGDYVSRRNSYMPLSGARLWARPVMEYAARMAGELKYLRARHAVLAVPGNHDHSKGRFEAIGNLLSEAGVHPLVNASVRVCGLPFVGLDDLRAGRLNLGAALEGVGRAGAQVILSHNPRVLPLLRGRNALVLTGHTHAGQVHLPGTNFRRRPKDMESSRFFQGWYAAEGARMYVSSGLGSVNLPLRLRCCPEITLFLLRRAPGDFEY